MRDQKASGEKIPVLTAYDYPTAKLLGEVGVPVILVGDSLGMVALGYPDTTHVTIEEMVHHTRAVARANAPSLLVADLPYRSYETPKDALHSAKQLISAGAHAVKLEGGEAKIEQIKALISEGIPVMGHLGMLPQSVKEEGGYHKKGKTEEERETLLKEALLIEEAGVFSLVLEMVIPEVAKEIQSEVKVPTIGIGSGSACDGQVLVLSDLVGAFPWFSPKFAPAKADVAGVIKKAAADFCREVRGEA